MLLQFAALVRSPKGVRNAFINHSLMHWWWKIVLGLHGKPVLAAMDLPQQRQILSAGFRFYGWIYRILAGALALFGLIQAAAGHVLSPSLCFLGAIYLWIVCGLAFRGSIELETSRTGAVQQWVPFLFGVAAFLMAFCGAIGVRLLDLEVIAPGLALAMMASFALFGAGSYMIELIYLLRLCADE